MTGFRRLAIADRGGPAIRCLAAVADLNAQSTEPITGIALYCDADRAGWFVRAAHEAVPMHVATPADVTVDAVMTAALAAGADAVWIGWQPLVSVEELTARCEAARLAVVGPGGSVFERLYDDAAAKRVADELGIATVGWRECDAADADAALRAADELGFPVLVRTAARAGGVQRLVSNREDLPEALRSAAAEAEHTCGTRELLLERWVRRARQLEVQVIGDAFGTVWALGVRDSSVQRQREKVLQESSCPVIDATMEESLLASAVRFATTIGYTGAGTADFLVDLDSGDALFRGFQPRLQAGHAVTEATTGVDLVALALRVARGERLAGEPPAASGHAIGVRVLAMDPEHGFVPSGGRLVFLRLPVGGGIRVDTGYTEGDVVDAVADPLFATVVAHGRDRGEALARLHRALKQLIVVIDAGTTTKGSVVRELAFTEVRDGSYDCGWLDRVVAHGDHLPAPHPLALLVAAVQAYEQEEEAVRDQFLASAARLRPSLPESVGHRVNLRLRGRAYRLRVLRIGPQSYRVESGASAFDLEVERLTRYELAVACSGSRHRVVVAGTHAQLQVEVDGIPYVLHRDDGVIVRSPTPAFVVDVKVTPGQHVSAGDPLVTLEAMKMLTSVTAPVDGVVAGVVTAVHTQVEVGAPLLRLALAPAQADPVGADVDFSSLTPVPTAPDPAASHALLRAYLLGYDLDDATARRLPALQAAAAAVLPPDDRALLAGELELVEIFTDMCALTRRDPDPVGAEDAPTASAQEHLFTFLSHLDVDHGSVPAAFVDRLRAALARYDVTSLDRSPALERALVQMYRSFLRLRELSTVATSVLSRWLHDRLVLVDVVGDRHRAALGRLTQVAPGRADDVADLAREVRYRFVDEPLLEHAAAVGDAGVAGWLAELTGDVSGPRAEELVTALSWSPRPLRARLRDCYLGADQAARDRILAARVRRFYRSREVADVHCTSVGGHRICLATYRSGDGQMMHLVSAYAGLDELSDLATSLLPHLAGIEAPGTAVIDVETWSDGPQPEIDEMAQRVRARLEVLAPDRAVRRVDVTVTSTGAAPDHLRTQHVTLRPVDGAFVEDLTYRNLHPMIAKRLEVWRWSEFVLDRVPSAEDVYVFVATGKDNPADVRLVALAEVRDLTPARDSSGQVIGFPLLERQFGEALTTIRHALGGRRGRNRPMGNRVVLYVRPTWDIPTETWRAIAHQLAPLSTGLGLEKVQVRVHLAEPGGDAVFELTGVAEHGVTVRVRPPSTEPIPTLTDYRQRVLKAERAGAPYPYELVKMLTPPADAPADFPPGTFREWDLAEDASGLVPVDREPGRNTCGIVAGVVTSFTATVPEGMSRVALFGDPTRGLGNLAEAECRRIIAAIDLAERTRVPLEWYALSSGARIAMDSGTENMDWISAVLRRLIEFTQAGGEVNIVVTGINVGAQPYWNAEATMLMHTRGVLIMTPSSAMVLTGKSSLDYSGGVSAEDNTGIGGFDRVMGPNGQGQYWAPDLAAACMLLLRHYDHTYVVPGEPGPRRTATTDPADRDVRTSPHRRVDGCDFETVGDVFSSDRNPDRKKPFDMRSVMNAVADTDCEPLERWGRWRDAETAIVWDARVAGIPVCMLGIESRPLPRSRFVPADGPPAWTSGTLFPQSSRKLARAINSASGNRPLVVLANLSGFDGSPESMRKWQLEYGAEIGRAVTNFRGPIVFVVVSRYHGGAFVVFSKKLNESMEIAAVEGSYASVIGGAPAAAVVFARDVNSRTDQDPRIAAARSRLADAPTSEQPALRRELASLVETVHAEKLKEVADEFDAVHDIRRAQRVGSVDLIVPARELRPYIVGALERGQARAAAQPGLVIDGHFGTIHGR